MRPASEGGAEFAQQQDAVIAVTDTNVTTAKCATTTDGVCDSGSLLTGVGNYDSSSGTYVPWTIPAGSCTENASYLDTSNGHAVNSIRVAKASASTIQPGDTVTVQVGYSCLSTASDFAEVFYASNTTSPSWVRVYPTGSTPFTCGSTGTISFTTTLAAVSGDHVFRAIVRHGTPATSPTCTCGTMTSCGSLTYADTDDLVFTVGGGIGFANGASTTVGRAGHTATLLSNGDVFIAGGAANSEMYYPNTLKQFYPAGTDSSRSYHTATRLTNGKVFVAGGSNGASTLQSSLLFDQKTNGYASGPTLSAAREGHTATLLPSGKVLLAGGVQNFTTYLATAELYDPSTNAVANISGGFAGARNFHTASLLQNGKVLIAGGFNGTGSVGSLSLYDPSTNAFGSLPVSLTTARRGHTATVLQDGKVLIVGGRADAGYTNTVEVYDPTSGNITATGSLTTARSLHTATLLPDGKVLVTGGIGTAGALNSAEVYTPSLGTWSSGGTLGTGRYQHTAVMLTSAQVLLVGGSDNSGVPLSMAEIYTFAGTPTSSARPTISNVTSTVAPGQTLTVVGTKFRGAVSEGSSGGTQSSAADVPVPVLTSTSKTYLSAYSDSSTSVSADLACSIPFGTYSLSIVSDGLTSTTSPTVTVAGLTQGDACICDEACSGKPPNAQCYNTTGACSNGQCSYPAKTANTTCNDGVSCTYNDVCDGSGTCAGTAYTCTPNQCQTSSTCNGNGGCTVSNKSSGTGCDDGNLCTTSDICDGGGSCGGTTKVCNAPPAPVCVSSTTSRVYNAQGACVPASGNCNYTSNDINCAASGGTCNAATGLCNTNTCAGVSCNTPPNTQCFASTGTCSNGSCSYTQKSTNSTCDDGNPCTTSDKCDAAGVCKGTLVAVNTSCNDGDSCSSGDKCDASGVCAGTPIVCNSPTDPQCVTSSAGTCVNGTCQYPTKTNGTACDDSNACSQTSSCQAGICTGQNVTVCTASDQCHTAGTCDPATGVCSNPTKANNTSCSDGSACTVGDKCQSGVCVSGAPVVCSAIDDCHTAGTCNPSTGFCSTPTKPDNSFCSDGSLCTSGDRCIGGVCTPTADTTCPPPDQCHFSGWCDPSSGSCDYTPLPDWTSCDDGNACTIGDSCQSGSCVPGTPTVCQATDQCHDAGVCNPSTGQCSNPTKTNGAACDDGSFCTQTDSCQAGVCKGQNPVVCTAIDACHDVGTCDPSSGTCNSPPKQEGASCDDGNKCTQTDVCRSGLCQGSNPVKCDPKDTCHEAGICNPSTGRCSEPQKPEQTSCDDGNKCTRTDACEAGVCKGSNAVECAPPKECQTGGCDTDSGDCKYASKEDGTPCSDGTCQSGECVNPADAERVAKKGCACSSDAQPAAWIMGLMLLAMRRRVRRMI